METNKMQVNVSANLKEVSALTELLDFIKIAPGGREFARNWAEKYPADGLFDLTTGVPVAPPTVPENTGRMIGAAYNTINAIINGPGVQLMADQADEFFQQATKDGQILLMKMAAFLANSSSTYVPYPTMVNQLFKGMANEKEYLVHAAVGCSTEANEVLDTCAKRLWIYGNQITDKDKDGQPYAINLLEELGDLYFYMQAIMNLFAWTIDDVMLHNRLKLAKRYPDGVYTNKAANERADKQ